MPPGVAVSANYAPSTLPTASIPDLESALGELFGFSGYRAHQREAVAAALSGRDVLVVMPTGAGKSLCFQLPAALTDGVTLVVSPLVALMRDQVAALRARPAFRRLGCAYLNSLQSSEEQGEVLAQLRAGMLKLLYVAPERFRSAAFVGALGAARLARFVVDEAHCISEWGHDFRPDYLTLKNVVESLGRPPLMAVTATATVRVQDSIVANLGMREPFKLVGGFDRPNLHFSVHRCKSETERLALLGKALPRLAAMGGSGLIYASTRKSCEEVAAVAARALAPQGVRAGAYHAGLDAAARNALQNQWLAGELQVLVATNAFGMGIDKPDVRFVVHYAYPESIESYYQEAGRAGRDGRKSRCVVLYHFADRRMREWFIENDELTPADVQAAHRRLGQLLAPGAAPPASATAMPVTTDSDAPASVAAKADRSAIVAVPRQFWGQALGWNEVKGRLALGELERAGQVQRLAESGDETTIKILRSDFARPALARVTADLKKRRDERFRRLDEMVGYCKTATCRRRTTLDYFGDTDAAPTPAAGDGKIFCCDNCERPPGAAQGSTAGSAAGTGKGAAPGDHIAMPADLQGGDIHVLLQGIDALRPQVGKARLGKLLRGAAAKDVQRFRDEGCPLYGALRTASAVQVESFLDALIAAGLLHQGDEDEYFVCRLTRAGREAWQGRNEIDIVVPGVPGGSDGLDATAGDLFEALRAWRSDEARKASVPPYVILGDKTLLELAHHQPQSEDTLLGISGIGPVKVQRYGAALLALIQDAL